MVVPVILIAVLAVLALTAIRIVGENERLVVFRFGRFYQVLGPGLRSVLPGVDRTARFRLDTAVPNWRELSDPELEAKLHELISTGQIPINHSI